MARTRHDNIRKMAERKAAAQAERERQHTELVQALLQHLNEISVQDEICSMSERDGKCVMHIWSDKPPVEDTSSMHQLALSDAATAMQPASADNDCTATNNASLDETRKRKLNPQQITEQQSEEKPTVGTVAHENESASAVAYAAIDQPMCSLHFFYESCRKRYISEVHACGCVHPPPLYKTLGSVIGVTPDSIELLKQCRPAMRTHEWAITHSIDKLYYISIDLDCAYAADTHSEYVSAVLSRWQIPLSSLVYVTLNNKLLYDRNQQGLQATRGKAEVRREDVQITLTGNDTSTLYVGMTGQLLEYVLSFLTEEYLLTMLLTCKSWYTELEGGSEQFWQDALDRRLWPHSTCNKNPVDLPMRQAYADPHAVCKKVAAIQQAAVALTDYEVGTDVACHYFDKVSKEGTNVNTCVGIEILSTNRVLAVFQYRCTFCLYESTHADTLDPWWGIYTYC
jgi:hypothetical protein